MYYAVCGSPLSTGLPRPVAFPALRESTAKTAIAAVLADAAEVGMEEERFEKGFVAAVRLYERGNWVRAFEELIVLADDGNAPAAKLALLMLRYGSNLYGVAFHAQPLQIARWAQYVLGRTTCTVRNQRTAPSSHRQ